MLTVELQPVANQSFTVQLDGARYELTLREVGGVMSADIARDGVPLLQGARLVAGTPLIPYAHMTAGNFVLLTENDSLPYYFEFGLTQSLVYLTAAEVAAAGVQ